MKRVRKPPTPIKWAEDICAAVYMTGGMREFSRGECFRVSKLLKKGIKEGRVVKTGRGRYLAVAPKWVSSSEKETK